MVSPLVFYQLGFLALLWLCIMLHYAWPNDRAAPHQSPSQPASPLHKRSREGIVGDHWCDGVGRSVTLRGKIAHPLVIARPPAPALPPSAGARRSGLSQYSGNPTYFHKKTCEIFWQAVSDNLHFRPYSVAKSQTKMVSPIRKFARIPPVGWQGMTAKTADNYDKAQSGAPHYAPAAPLSRTTTR
jgi:hypothetical protein